MTQEEEMKIIEEIRENTIKKCRLLYGYEIKEILDKFVDDLDQDAKEASIPYSYNAPEHDWKCGYPTDMRGTEPIQRKLDGCRKGGKCEDCADKYVCEFSALRER